MHYSTFNPIWQHLNVTIEFCYTLEIKLKFFNMTLWFQIHPSMIPGSGFPAWSIKCSSRTWSWSRGASRTLKKVLVLVFIPKSWVLVSVLTEWSWSCNGLAVLLFSRQKSPTFLLRNYWTVRYSFVGILSLCATCSLTLPKSREGYHLENYKMNCRLFTYFSKYHWKWWIRIAWYSMVQGSSTTVLDWSWDASRTWKKVLVLVLR